MKYVVDIDALKNCLELIPQCTVNGEPYVSLDIVQAMIAAFPKDNECCANVRSRFDICMNCGNYGWDMPQCVDCNSENGFKHFTRKYNDNE